MYTRSITLTAAAANTARRAIAAQARAMHACAVRRGAANPAQYGGSYDTPTKIKDPWKTRSSGYSDNDQGFHFLRQTVRSEDLDAAAKNPSPEEGALAGEESASTIDETTQNDMLGSYRPSRLG